MMPVPLKWLLTTRTTKGNYAEPVNGATSMQDCDDWTKDPGTSGTSAKRAPGIWTGTTAFHLDLDKKLSREGLDAHPCKVDYYEQSGPVWKRHHTTERT